MEQGSLSGSRVLIEDLPGAYGDISTPGPLNSTAMSATRAGDPNHRPRSRPYRPSHLSRIPATSGPGANPLSSPLV